MSSSRAVKVTDESGVLDLRARKSILWKGLKIFLTLTSVGVVISVIILFVVIPIVFMLSIEVQRLAMFTNIGLLSDQSEFERNLKLGMRNLYITVRSNEDDSLLSLGVYHILPASLIKESATNKSFSYDKSLKYSNYSVLLYFHGSGEDRSDSIKKYFVMNLFFHVIAFDYRDFGDSTSAKLTEEAIAQDSVQVYKWIRKKTNADIYFWGHSMGTSLAVSTIVKLKEENVKPTGLILEAPFTSMKEEIPVHPYGKIFKWLPWFGATILDPLEKNGFTFETDKNIVGVQCPIMILHSEDDSIIPYTLGQKLYHIAKDNNEVEYYQFAANSGYDHFFIYESKNLPTYIENFIKLCNNKSELSFEFIDPDKLVKN